MKKRYKTLLLGGVGLLTYAFIEPFRYIVKHYEISHPCIPQVFDGYRIVFLADLHYGRMSKRRFFSKVVRRSNAFKPDVVLLGGDYITHKNYIEPCFRVLKQLQAKQGIYAVTGNHDVIEDLEKTLRAMKEAGIVCLNNKSQWLTKGNERIKIGGVGDLNTQTQCLKATTHDMKQGDYGILLTHNPKYITSLPPHTNIGLCLGGHTHGAQFASIRHLTKWLPKKYLQKSKLAYLSGKYERQDMDIIVSNGVGTAKFPFRFFTPPEMITITLNAPQKKDIQ